MVEPQYTQQIFFDPDEHPEDTLKAFKEFCQTFELCYNAQYPDPPKVSINSAIQRWKVENATEDAPDPKPSLAQYDAIHDGWRSKDKVAKFLRMFSSNRLFADGKFAQPNNSLEKKQTGTHLWIE